MLTGLFIVYCFEVAGHKLELLPVALGLSKWPNFTVNPIRRKVLLSDRLLEETKIEGSPSLATSIPVSVIDVPTSSISSSQETPSLPVVLQPTVTPTSVPTNIVSSPGMESIAGIPPSTQITRELSKGEVMILTGGRIKLGEFYCGNEAEQICVVIVQATQRQKVMVDNLIALNNWLGRTSILTPEEVIAHKLPEFWQSPNCGNGCSKATIGLFEDDKLIDTQIIER